MKRVQDVLPAGRASPGIASPRRVDSHRRSPKHTNQHSPRMVDSHRRSPKHTNQRTSLEGRLVDKAETCCQTFCGTCCARCSTWIMRESDTPEDIRIKRLMTPVCVVLLALQSIFLLLYLSGRYFQEGTTVFIACGVCMAAEVLFIVRGMLGMDTRVSVDAVLVLLAVGTLLTDLYLVSELRVTNWQNVVVILDLALVFDRPSTIPFVLGLTLVYAALDSAESAQRFGLYNVVAHQTPPVCACSDPPCALGNDNGLQKYLFMSFALCVDFYLTRGFATDLRRQLRSLGASVQVAAEIAGALAKYDVDAAERVIASSSGNDDLPSELVQSFMQLLHNLRSYKAYLPHSVLVPEEEVLVPKEEVAPQGALEESQWSLSVSGGRAVSGSPTFSLYPDNDSNADPVDDACSVSASWPGSAASTHTEPAGLSQPVLSRPSSMSNMVRDLRAVPRCSRVSLAAGNMVGYLSSSGDLACLAGDANIEWIAADVERWCSVVFAAKGVVDLIGGDRRYASFNARQVCGGHSS
eukprot:Hpha_TRINITY_DN16224_c2_g1::TRINITY_DN16224_c2_g1_i2::g.11966::m.11966